MAEVWRILHLMAEYDVPPNQRTFDLIFERVVAARNIELALQLLSEMSTLGLSPSLRSAQSIIISACDIGFPRLALDLAHSFEHGSARRLDNHVWMACLVSSAENLYSDGVGMAWHKVVNELNMIPDEGCCINILNTVGRHGLASLGMQVLRVLKSIGVSSEEYHFAPVIEAFCHDNNIKEAFAVLEIMRSSNVTPVAETAFPIFQLIQKDTDSVDEAWDILNTMFEEGKTIDVAALNVVVQASVALGDLQRAIGTYKAFSELKVTPTVDTYNTLLSGCIQAKHRELGDRLLGEMKQAGVKPDDHTYERLIILCLTQPTYEDAFFYLEEMKSEGHLPTQPIYEAVVRKCVSVGDTRHKLALDEMLEHGYEMSQKLKAFVDSGGEHGGAEERLAPSERVAEHKRREWVGDNSKGGARKRV